MLYTDRVFSLFLFSCCCLFSNRKTHSRINNLGVLSCSEVHNDCKRGSKNEVLSWNMYCTRNISLPVPQFSHSTDIHTVSKPTSWLQILLYSLHVKRCFLRLVFMIRKRLYKVDLSLTERRVICSFDVSNFCVDQHNGCTRFLGHSAENISFLSKLKLELAAGCGFISLWMQISCHLHTI